MYDLFDDRKARPMLIKQHQDPFDSDEFIYELKIDGVRELLYLDNNVDMRNKKNVALAKYFPELKDIYKQVSDRCILDGELAVFIDGKADFDKVLRRAIMRDEFKIDLASKKNQVSFVVFDILYYKDKELINLPLMERKEILQSVVNEGNRLIISRHIETYGKQFFELVKEQNLEGIVAKRKDSEYYMGKRTDVWIKSKVYDTIDAVVCGYMYKKDNMTSIIIGQYREKKLIYKGHVTLGGGLKKISKHGYKMIEESPFGYTPRSSEGAIWIQPDIVCLIEYMPTENTTMRLPVFKNIRDDKTPIECQVDE